MKPSRQNKAAAGANVCDCEERCLHVCSRLRGGQRGGEVMRFKTTFCTVVLTKNAYGFLHLLRLLYIYIYIYTVYIKRLCVKNDISLLVFLFNVDLKTT